MNSILFENFWIMLILTTLINGVLLKLRIRQYVAVKPELEEGYNKAALYFVTIGNIPWIIMGFGMIMGYTNNSFDFFRPRDLNPVVLLFHASIIIINGLIAYWVFIGKGADFFIKYPGLFIANSMGTKKKFEGVNEIKTVIGLMMMGSLIAILAMWFMDLPLINF